MTNTQKKIRSLALTMMFFSPVTFAVDIAGFPLSIGFDGGVTDVEYKGEKETGYFWAINGNLQLNNFSSIYSGYGETTADFPDENGINQSFTSKSIPLALQINVPILIGNAYARAGGNYYENSHGVDIDEGWGILGAIGFSFSTGIGPGAAIELTYQDRGDAETSSISVGAKFGI